MEPDPVSSLQELLRVIDELPSPPPGHRRVFRGQAANYPTMKPAALRGARHVDDHIFRVYTQLLGERLRDEQGAPEDQTAIFLIWTRAIAQHYGPGTEFLDVTRTLDVAVWFALNKAERVPVKTLFGAPGPADPEHDTPAEFLALRFVPNEGLGYVSVFDVPLWELDGQPENGMLVDLASAPELFASSPRLQIQDACLLYADRRVNEGDLKPLARTIPVSRPIADCAFLQKSASDLFPEPTIDPWYQRLLSVPLVHRLPAAAETFELMQAVPVTLYVDAASWERTSRRLIVLPPPIIWPEIEHELHAAHTWLPVDFYPAAATPILLELPIFLMTPPLESDQWNHAFLADGTPTEASATDVASGEDHIVDLTRVLIEFSPLEFGPWEEVETTKEELVFARGAYLERDGDTYRLWWISQSFPGCERTVAGPFLFFFDRVQRVFQGGTSESPLPLAWPAKTLFVVLTVLRELADEPLVCPFPTIVSDGEVFIARVQGKAARMVRARTLRGDALFTLRHPTRNEPFNAGSNDAGVVIVRGSAGWQSLTLEQVRQAIPRRQDHGQTGRGGIPERS